MRTRRYNYFALAQPGVLFTTPTGPPEGGGTTPPAAPPATPPAPPATPPVTPPTTPPATPPVTPPEAGKVEDLPAWAQKIITEARKDAGDNRVAKNAADAKQQEFIRALAKAAGVEVPGDAPADPAKLTEQLTAAASQQRKAEVNLAVFQAASTAGANPVALLDRNSFTKTLEGLDPTAADFSTKVTEAITAAVTADPSLKSARAAGSSTVDHGAGGSGDTTPRTPKTLDQAVAGHYSA